MKAVWDHILPLVQDQPNIEIVWGALWDSLFTKGADVIAGKLRGE